MCQARRLQVLSLDLASPDHTDQESIHGVELLRRANQGARFQNEPHTPQAATGALAGPKPGLANKGLVFFGRGGAI